MSVFSEPDDVSSPNKQFVISRLGCMYNVAYVCNIFFPLTIQWLGFFIPEPDVVSSQNKLSARSRLACQYPCPIQYACVVQMNMLLYHGSELSRHEVLQVSRKNVLSVIGL